MSDTFAYRETRFNASRLHEFKIEAFRNDWRHDNHACDFPVQTFLNTNLKCRAGDCCVVSFLCGSVDGNKGICFVFRVKLSSDSQFPRRCVDGVCLSIKVKVLFSSAYDFLISSPRAMLNDLMHINSSSVELVRLINCRILYNVSTRRAFTRARVLRALLTFAKLPLKPMPIDSGELWQAST